MTEWNVETALNHHPACSVYDNRLFYDCTCGFDARREQLERTPLAPGEGTWSVFAQKVVEERDAAREEVARLRAEVDVLRRAALGEAAENDRLRRQVDSLIEAADAARLLLLFAAGPHEAGAVPAMLAAAIERAKGKKP